MKFRGQAREYRFNYKYSLSSSPSSLCSLVLAICFLPFALSAQVLCEGNFGDNIFTEGDFGSGTANVVPLNPGYAPGFMYTTQVPPDDGEYTITNNTTPWTNLYPTWLRIGDNDIDPNGYMMVVNASFSPGVFYEQIIDNLCENTFYEFSADVLNIVRNGTAGHILPNVSFLLDDVVKYSTGQIAQDEEWHTYGFTFTTGPGQFSVKLTLRNNAPGGIGNDLALDNISFRACGPESSVSIDPLGKVCENSIFPTLTAHIAADTGVVQWQVSPGDEFNFSDIPGATGRTHQVQQLSAGVYYFRYLYGSTIPSILNPKCRIVSNVIEVEIVPVEFTIHDTLCEGLVYELAGNEYGETGTYQHQFTATNGCDSIVTLELVIVDDPMIEVEFGTNPASCEGANDGGVFMLTKPNIRPPFTFRVDDSIVPPPSTYISLPPGTYTAWIETPYGCYYNEEVIIPDGPPLDVEATGDTTIVLGHDVLLQSTVNFPNASIIWNDTSTLDCHTCLETIATPVDDITTYVITATTSTGCIDKDSVTIRIDRTPVLYVPNVFTPNFDGINDYFEIGLDPVNITAIEQVLIFDRWGGVLSESGNISTENKVKLWDGETPRGPAMPGMYVYFIKFRMADNSSGSVSGDVTLIR